MRIIKYLLMVPLNLFFFISFMIPKNERLWLISAWYGEKFLDNPKYIYKELLHGDYDVDVYWVVKDKSCIPFFSENEYPVIWAYSLKGIWLQLRAKNVIFSHSLRSEFLPCFIASQTKKIQTWHGVPIKKIGYDDKNANLDSLIKKIIIIILPFLREEYDLIIASSKEDKSIYHTAFRTPLKKIIVTGYPRNDAIYKSLIEQNFKITQTKKIIYMPTLRGGIGDFFPYLSDHEFDFVFLDKMLDKINAEFYIKLHPVQRFKDYDLELMKQTKNIYPVFNNDDIYEVIAYYDILITDYSGIYFDFLITGKPIVMAPIDLKSYTSTDREIYYNYDEICPSEPCRDWGEVLRKLELIVTNPMIDERYKSMQRRFHSFFDGDSSKRVINEIKNIN